LLALQDPERKRPTSQVLNPVVDACLKKAKSNFGINLSSACLTHIPVGNYRHPALCDHQLETVWKNATAMDQEQVPIATRENRLGQSDARTTMGYTRAMSQDGRVFAARFGQMLTVGNA
jgi:hypothetical protein